MWAVGLAALVVGVILLVFAIGGTKEKHADESDDSAKSKARSGGGKKKRGK